MRVLLFLAPAALVLGLWGAFLAGSEPPDTGPIHIDGNAPPILLGVTATPSGTWPTYHLGDLADGKAYLFTYDAKPGWWSVCVVRYPGYGPAGSAADAGAGRIGERVYSLDMAGASYRIAALPGSMKCVDNGAPVKADMARVVAAVRAGRSVPYTSAAFAGWYAAPPMKVAAADIDDTYRADRIYGRSSSLNAIGVVSGQGGEYHSSRGFVSSEDAVLIAAALAGDTAAFDDAAARGRVQTLYGLSLPHFAVWSRNHHALRDPQIPLPGDGPYTNEGTAADIDNFADEGAWRAPPDYPYLAEIRATAGATYMHTRDASHLFNHGYAYWLATGDPRAALLSQATAAYALASVWQGADADGSYRGQFEYQRWTINLMTAMWKLRDVAMHANGPLLWPKVRTDRMVAGVMDDWTANIALMDTPGAALPWKTAAQTTMMSAFRAYDGTTSFSKFMSQIYGAEVAYLWARAGRGELLTRLAENMVIRARDVGGARGIDGDGGSELIAMDGAAPTRAAIVAKLNARTAAPNDRFDGAEAHVVVRAYWLLRMANDAAKRGWIAPVAGAPEAMARMEADRARTDALKWPDILAPKHAGVTF